MQCNNSSLDLGQGSAHDAKANLEQQNDTGKISALEWFFDAVVKSVLGSNSEVRARNWAARFILKNRRRQPGLSGPKSAKNRRMRCSKQVLFDHLVGSHQYGGGHRSNVEGSASGSPQDVAGTTARDPVPAKSCPL
jgi:hypothetical protein